MITITLTFSDKKKKHSVHAAQCKLDDCRLFLFSKASLKELKKLTRVEDHRAKPRTA